VVLALVLFAGAFFVVKYKSHKVQNEALKQIESLPSPERSAPTSEAVGVPTESVGKYSETPEAEATIPAELNLDVPFTSQAPGANWDYTHEEACEEATMLMANRYFQGREISGQDDAEEGIQQIIAWEKENLGFFESTTAEESTRVIKEMLNLKADIISNPGVDEIKRALSEKKLVIVPAAGRQLGNPFYKSPGPLYHFLLIKGYTEKEFITNDAGTKRGANYPYKFETIFSANHDWNGGDVDAGKKVMILVYK